MFQNTPDGLTRRERESERASERETDKETEREINKLVRGQRERDRGKEKREKEKNEVDRGRSFSLWGHSLKKPDEIMARTLIPSDVMLEMAIVIYPW